MEELREKWEKFEKIQKKIELDLSLVTILSLKDFVQQQDQTDATFRKIEPYKLEIKRLTKAMDVIEFPLVKITNLTSAQLEMLKETGLAFIIDGHIYLAEKSLFRSFVDLFGIAKAASVHSLARDLLLSVIFNEYENVIASYSKCDNRKTIMAFHRRDLQLGINVYSLAVGLMEKENVKIKDVLYTKTSFQVELLLNEEIDSWNKTLIIKDNVLGRESFKVIVAYRKNNAIVYLDEMKISHRIKVSFEEIYPEIMKLIKGTNFTLNKVSFKSIESVVKKVIGKRKMPDFKNMLSEKMQESVDEISPDRLLEIAASADNSQYGSKEDEYRSHLGIICKTC